MFENIKNLNGKTLFYHYISKDKDKLSIYNKAVSEGKITDFDQVTITRLRKKYYGFYSGLIYIYMEPTSFSNIGNKLELLTHVFEDKEYNIVHGNIDSIKNIRFFEYGVEHLDYNSWLEVKEGNKIWVYDLFSLMKIEKEVYYQLENPQITQIINKKRIIEHPHRDNQEYDFNDLNEVILKKVSVYKVLLKKTIKDLKKNKFLLKYSNVKGGLYIYVKFNNKVNDNIFTNLKDYYIKGKHENETRINICNSFYK